MLLSGADRGRTDDLRLAKPALSQLSYNPINLVGLARLELATSRLSGVRSNQLSYRPGSRATMTRSFKTKQQTNSVRWVSTFVAILPSTSLST